MRTAIALFTRDLRVQDNPALAAAVREAERVVPLFVRDDAVDAAPNRLAFLHESLRDLDLSLRQRGAALVVRRGDTAAEVTRVVQETGAEAVHASRDVSAFAGRRESRLARNLQLRLHDGLTVVPPDELHPYRVFSPYYRAWQGVPLPEPEPAPERIVLPDGLDLGRLDAPPPPDSPGLPPGGEHAGRARMAYWLRDRLAGYRDRQRLDLDATSRLSPYLHFGCISALELVRAAGVGDFTREVAWRDFYAQLMLHEGMGQLRDRGDAWDGDAELFDAWRAGETGYPVVDAGMRQLRAEGWMHNRARLITASFLTKHLYLDWRLGARHFFDLLVDGDQANNIGNWQWVAGVGTDTRPYRVYNPTLQAKRHDPDGEYVRRWVTELAGLGADEIHEPWKLPASRRRGYPEPIVEHTAAVRRFRERRSGQLTLTDA
jgi:deoxyribodipyrimidine photo-lyase